MIGMPSPLGLSSTLRRRRRTGITGAHPGCNSYNAVMKAYANARGTKGEEHILLSNRPFFPHNRPVVVIVSIRSSVHCVLQCLYCRKVCIFLCFIVAQNHLLGQCGLSIFFSHQNLLRTFSKNQSYAKMNQSDYLWYYLGFLTNYYYSML